MLSWFRQLEAAKSSIEVVAIARDYLATWLPDELARLPVSCRPGRLRDEKDVENLHACLVEAYRDTRATGEELRVLQELTSFLVRASIRIAELADADKPGTGGPGDGSLQAAARPGS